MSAGSKLDRLQEQAVAALLTSRTHAEAAAAVGISEATIQRWLQIEEFQAAYRAARRAVVEAAVGELQKAMVDAVAVLRRNFNCGSPGVEVRAALGVLAQGIKAVEMLDVMDLLRQLHEVGNGTN